MDFNELFRSATNALWTNRTRSLLTTLGIVVGVFAVILLTSIGQGLKVYVTEQFASLGAETMYVVPGELEFAPGGGGGQGVPGAGISASKFTTDMEEDLERGEYIRHAMSYSEFNGTMKYRGKSHTTIILGGTSVYPDIRNQFTTKGRFFNRSEENSARRVAVLGSTVSEELFGQENPVGKKVTLADQRFNVVGVLEEEGSLGNLDLDDQIIIPITTALRVFDQENIQSFWVQATSTEDVPKAKAEIEQILGKTLKDEDFSTIDTKSMLNVVSSVLNSLTLAVAGIAAISLVVGGIGIMNIMLVSVTERTREIGLRKSLGATRADILIQFLIESIILASIGGVIGITLGVLGAFLIGQFFTTFIPLWSVVIAFLASAAVGIIFGVAPAMRAARLNPIEALRYE